MEPIKEAEYTDPGFREPSGYCINLKRNLDYEEPLILDSIPMEAVLEVQGTQTKEALEKLIQTWW